MPTPEARAAFDDAQQIAAQMRSLHEQEQQLEVAKDQTSDLAAIGHLHRDLVDLRRQWTRLAQDYTEAVGRFNRAVEEARRQAIQ